MEKHQPEADLMMKGMEAGTRMEDIVIGEGLAAAGGHQVLVAIQMVEAGVRVVQAAIVEEVVHQETLVTDHLHIAHMAEVLTAEATMAVEKVHLHQQDPAALQVVQEGAAKKHLQDEIIK